MACMECRVMENSALVEALVSEIGPSTSTITRRRDIYIYDYFWYLIEIRRV